MRQCNFCLFVCLFFVCYISNGDRNVDYNLKQNEAHSASANHQTRGLIDARKTSHKHSKDMSCLLLCFCGVFPC